MLLGILHYISWWAMEDQILDAGVKREMNTTFLHVSLYLKMMKGNTRVFGGLGLQDAS